MLAQQDPIILEAAKTLYRVTEDERVRMHCEALEAGELTYRTLVLESEEQMQQINEQRQLLAEQHKQLDEQHKQIDEQHKQICEKDSEIERLKAELAALKKQ